MLEKSEMRKAPYQVLQEIRTSLVEKNPAVDEHLKSRVETYTLVAALIATVTFAANFTMPGGYNQEHGYALLAKHPAFKVFVVANAIAVCSSLIVVFCFILAWTDTRHFSFQQLVWGHRLTVIASLAMMVAFMTAGYVVLDSQCKPIAILVCIICGSALVALLVLLISRQHTLVLF